MASRVVRRNGLRKGGQAKQQSAIEYIISYSWALLLIAAILLVLFQLGIFNGFNFGPRAQPGSCSVTRTTAGLRLVGICGSLPPEYIAQLNNRPGAVGGGVACVNSTIPSINTSMGAYTTVSMWLNWNGTQNQTPAGFTGYYLWFSSPNTCIGFTTGKQDDWGINFNSMINTWTMVTAAFYSGSATNSILYINGVQQPSFQCQGTAHTGVTKTNLLIASSSGSKFRYGGGMTNVQVYNKSLDANVILAMYYEGIGGDPIDLTHLVAWFPLNGNANDYSGNSQNINIASCAFSYISSYPIPASK